MVNAGRLNLESDVILGSKLRPILLSSINDIAKHSLKSGWQDAGFDFGLVNVSEVENSRNVIVDDKEWISWKKKNPNLLNIEKVSKIENVVQSLSNIANDKNRTKEDLNLYLSLLTKLTADLLFQISNSKYSNAPVIFPLRTSALIGEEVINYQISLHKMDLVIPIRTSRISRGTSDKPKYSVGISSMDSRLCTPIKDDLKKLVKDKKLRVVQVTIASGLTGIALMKWLEKIEMLPASIEFLAPIVSRKGIMNTIEYAKSRNIDVQISTMYASQGLGDIWSSESDTIQMNNGDNSLVEVLGNASDIVGMPFLHAAIGKVRGAFEARHDLDTSTL